MAKKIHYEPMDREVVQRIADIMGENSAAFHSLKSAGANDKFFRATRGFDSWIVVEHAKQVTLAAELNQPASPIQSIQDSPECLEQDVAK